MKKVYHGSLLGAPVMFFELPAPVPEQVESLVGALRKNLSLYEIKKAIESAVQGGKWLVNYRASCYGHLSVFEIAVQKCSEPIIKYLSQFVADFNDHSNDRQDSALQLAACYGKRQAVTLLLKLGAQADYQNLKGYSALLYAAQSGHQDIVHQLLNVHRPLVNIPANNLMTPLHAAVHANKPELVALLIRNGASVDMRASSGQTPAHLALELKFFDCFDRLFNYGEADVTLTDFMGRRFNDVGLEPSSGVHEKIKLRQARAYRAAVMLDNEFLLMQIISNGIDVNVTDLMGRAGLHYACEKNNLVLVKLLLENGAQCNLKDNDQKTPQSLLDVNGKDEFIVLQEQSKSAKGIRQAAEESKGYYIPLGVKISASTCFINALVGRPYDKVSLDDDCVSRAPTVISMSPHNQ